MRKRFLATIATIAAVGLTLGLGLTACGSDEPARKVAMPEGTQSLYDAAAKEGRLMWYCSSDPANCESVIKDFEAAYPKVKVDYLRLASGQLATRYIEERNAKAVVADVVSIADLNFYRQNLDYFVPLSAEGLPALDDYPADAVKLDSKVALISTIFNVVGYNTNLVKGDDIPKTWDDVLSPKFGNGKIAYGDPRVAVAFLAGAKVWLDELGPDFLTKLRAQKFVVSDSVVPASQRMAAGEFALVFPNVPSVIEALKKDGAPVDWTPVGPMSGPQHFVAISTDAKKENAAKLFANFLLTKQGQEAFNRGAGASPLGDLPGALDLPEGYREPNAEGIEKDKAKILGLLGLNS